MRILAIGFALGTGLLQLQGTLPSGNELIFILLASGCLFWIGIRLQHRKIIGLGHDQFGGHLPLKENHTAPNPNAGDGLWGMAGLLLMGITATLLGFAWAGWMAQRALTQSLPQAWEQKDILLTAMVTKIPTQTEDGFRFECEVQDWHGYIPSKPPFKHSSRGTSKNQPDTHNENTSEADLKSSLSPVIGAISPSQLPQTISLHWRKRGEELAVGSLWRMTVRLYRPRGTANPHTFDYDAWLLERDIRAIGYVRQAYPLPSPPSYSPRLWLEKQRQQIRTRLSRVLEGEAWGGTVIALAIGDQRAISLEQWDLFARTGISHLMSISGLHITLFAMLLGGLIRRFWGYIPRAVLYCPSPTIAAVLGFVAALLYALLSGWGIPAQRTILMLGIAAWSSIRGRINTPSRVLSLALGGVCLLDPWATLAPGFWLSFIAVALLMLSGWGLGAETDKLPASTATPGLPEAGTNKINTWLRDKMSVLFSTILSGIRAQAVISIGLIPATLALFGQISLVSPLANLLCIPVIGYGVAPLSLLAAFIPWDGIAHLALWLLIPLMDYVSWLGSKPWAWWHQATPPGLWVLWAGLGMSSAFLPLPVPWRIIGGLSLLPLLLYTPPRLAEGELSLSVLDVGQGLAVVARTREHTLVYDTGPRYSSNTTAGERILLPYLRGEGVSAIDTLILSHHDQDHVGGTRAILPLLKPNSTWLVSEMSDRYLGDTRTPPSLARAPSASQLTALPGLPQAQYCHRGQSWAWDGVQFRILSPLLPETDLPGDTKSPVKTDEDTSHPPLGLALPTQGKERRTRFSYNNRSCVLAIQVGAHQVLLTGDIEIPTEQWLVKEAAVDLPSLVLLSPHHGSRTSSGEAFLQAVRPLWVLISVGHLNRFHHPAPEVLQRYQQQGLSVLRTDQGGALLLRITSDSSPDKALSLVSWRQSSSRYWQLP